MQGYNKYNSVTTESIKSCLIFRHQRLCIGGNKSRPFTTKLGNDGSKGWKLQIARDILPCRIDDENEHCDESDSHGEHSNESLVILQHGSEFPPNTKTPSIRNLLHQPNSLRSRIHADARKGAFHAQQGEPQEFERQSKLAEEEIVGNTAENVDWAKDAEKLDQCNGKATAAPGIIENLQDDDFGQGREMKNGISNPLDVFEQLFANANQGCRVLPCI
ncbi:hypothetical protein C8J56DRAFT_933233 [Mycena floridula]|nr:hypothetical protein C8J56DRAFT_933233 [Mycena floridula]